MPRFTTSVTLPAPVTIRRLLVKVGDRVAVAQPIIELDQDQTYGDIARYRLDLDRAQQLVAQQERAAKTLEVDLSRLSRFVAVELDPTGQERRALAAGFGVDYFAADGNPIRNEGACA